MFMDGNKNFTGIRKKTLSNKEYLTDHRCERTNRAYKCKISDTVNVTFHGHYTHVCTDSKVIGKKYRKFVCQTKKTYAVIDAKK